MERAQQAEGQELGQRRRQQARALGGARPLRGRLQPRAGNRHGPLPTARRQHTLDVLQHGQGALALPLLRRRRRQLHDDHVEGGDRLPWSTNRCNHSRPPRGKLWKKRQRATRQPLRRKPQGTCWVADWIERRQLPTALAS
ncbi:DNA primase [Streptomyces phage Saftant]|uniref:DNA primase n=1 Tax=Streptomyces phage Saftant TaxID=2601693 RepID=A0A5J6D8K2_9CAUD|nr:DNA primase [Streptomyces phage Saftant]QEQ94071.1 DNA primase [Streptomyces phage Saftant]